jgi:drug/metabolite transporter (DMT)-like permease
MDRRFAAIPILALIFGSNFMFVKVAVEEASPLQIVTFRLIIGASVVALVMRNRSTAINWSAPLLARVTIISVTGTIIPFLLISWASGRIDSGLASVLNSSMPLFTALFAAAASDEQITAGRGTGLLVGFTGVIAMTGYAALDVSGDALGQIAVVGAAASFAASAVYARGLIRSHDAIGLAGAQLAIAAVLSSLLFAAAEGTPDYTLSGKVWVAMAFMGAVSGGLAYVMYIWLIGQIGSVRASLITYVLPIVALFLGWAVLDESIGANTLGGMALILAGIAIVMRAPAPRTAPTASSGKAPCASCPEAA